MNLEWLHALEQKLEAHLALPPSLTLIEMLNEVATALKTYDPARAITLTHTAIQYGRDLSEETSVLEARAWAIGAYCHIQLDQLDLAAEAVLQIPLLLQNESDPLAIGYAAFAQVWIYLERNNYSEALEAGLRGYELLSQIGDFSAQANIAGALVAIYSRLGDREQAEAYGFYGLEQYRTLKNPGGEMLLLNNLAVHFAWMNEPDTARQWGEEAIALIRQQVAGRVMQFPYIIPAVFHTVADIAIAQEDWAAAEAYLEEGLSWNREHPTSRVPFDEGYLTLALGKLCYRRGNLEGARRALIIALATARTLRHRQLMLEITQTLFALYETMGQYRRAFRYFRCYHEIEKQRYNDQLITKVRRLEAEYEVKVARREAQLLAEKNRQLQEAYVELKVANATIQELSIRDGLTHLYNRQYFEQWAGAAFQQAHEQGTPFGILLCDVDNFKRINDTWLHHRGDKVLQTIADIILSLCPAGGSVARYGGEEFVLGVPRYSRTQMHALAEQLRTAVEQFSWATIHPDMQVTISVGVMDNVGVTSLAEQLIQADLYLYLAKHQGRNRVAGGSDFLTPLVEGQRASFLPLP